jgi:hypothetical protein
MDTQELKRLAHVVRNFLPGPHDTEGRPLIPVEDQVAASREIALALLNELVGITREHAASGFIHDQQVHRYTTAAVARTLGL